MNLTIVTLFPGFFAGPLSTSLLGKAVGTGALSVRLEDPRELATDRHRSVDDVPYGGGAGMLMKPDIMTAAIERARADGPSRVLLLTPQGRPLSQADLVRWSRLDARVVLVAGRYEGFDERIRAAADEEVSLGDFVLTGGEYAALVIADGIARLLPGVLGNEVSPAADSFGDGLLEHAQYTRPPAFRGLTVPAVLEGGDHAAIARERRRDALARTRARRPELLARRGFDEDARRLLRDTTSSAPPVVVVVHPRAEPDDGAVDRWARLAAAYGVARWVIVAPAGHEARWAEALDRARARATAPAALRTPWPKGRAARARAEVARARASESWARALGALEVGARPSLPEATWVRADPEAGEGAVDPASAIERARGGALVLELGGPAEGAALASVRVAAPLNALGLDAAAAIVLDRLVGER